MINCLEHMTGPLGWAMFDAARLSKVLAGRRWLSAWGALKMCDSVLRGVAQVVDQSDCGASVGNTKITDLVFADDAVIFAESLEVLVMALEALHEEPKPLGLEVSWLKTKVQVVFVNNPFSGLLILIGLFLADTMTGVGTLYCTVIAFLVAKGYSSVYLSIGPTPIAALVVSQPPWEQVYGGVWGYNGFLAAGALVFFAVPTPRVLTLAILNAILATFIQAALIPVFAKESADVGKQEEKEETVTAHMV
ncbi:hypothetical protein GWK47_033618 [Chionoecetes opilio]|uniref:Reverse transcriptase domain-containing protein n=1 Tax=Chionoecetes opilio TaxID=41210 RepID=A0A8J4YW96_CHIOP|nr:hypothetical protein GWK47_033618 [Chionoecetes opilio]